MKYANLDDWNDNVGNRFITALAEDKLTEETSIVVLMGCGEVAHYYGELEGIFKSLDVLGHKADKGDLECIKDVTKNIDCLTNMCEKLLDAEGA